MKSPSEIHTEVETRRIVAALGYTSSEFLLTRRCSEPRARLRLTLCVFAIDGSGAWIVAPVSRSLILCLVRWSYEELYRLDCCVAAYDCD